MPACSLCHSDFEITAFDRELLARLTPSIGTKKFSLPEPTLCPLCRAQRRSIWRAELQLFKRKSAFSGKSLITFFPPQAPVQVISDDEFWSDKFDAVSYGRDFDFSRPFFEQFAELISAVPLKSLSGSNNQNSDYINCASWCKNCYLVAGANYNEDCLYGNYVNHSRSCVDCNFVDHCELCYECVDCTHCYNLRYSDNCSNCFDSFFLHNCRGCKSCFGCANLVNKEFCFFNEQLTKAEYLTRLAALPLKTRSGVATLTTQFNNHTQHYPNKFMIGERNQDVSGQVVHSCKNTFYSFDVSELEDCAYATWFHQAKSCMDVLAWGFPAELCYECTEVGQQSYRTMFSVTVYGAVDLLYSYYMFYCKSCFGCVSLKKNEHCVFNKQYSPAEYEKLVTKIIEHMQRTGEWGQFFPMSTCPLGYNTALTADYFPLPKEVACSIGARWYEPADDLKAPASPQQVPDDISSATNAVCRDTFLCRETGRPYKIIEPEFAYYKKENIPLPDISFMARHRHRLARRTPRALWDRNCDKCATPIKTSYPPYGSQTVFCEACYFAEVY